MPKKKDAFTEMLAEIGLDSRNAPPAGTPEFNEWMKAQASDPKVRARAAAVFTSQPEMQNYVEQAQEILETRAMRLLERPDFEPLLLSMREVTPALELMNRRTHKLQQLFSQEKPLPQKTKEQMRTVWTEVILDSLPVLLSPARRARLVSDLQSYAQQQNDHDATQTAYTALLMLDSIADDSHNRFLLGYVLQSIRSALKELSHRKIVDE